MRSSIFDFIYSTKHSLRWSCSWRSSFFGTVHVGTWRLYSAGWRTLGWIARHQIVSVVWRCSHTSTDTTESKRCSEFYSRWYWTTSIVGRRTSRSSLCFTQCNATSSLSVLDYVLANCDYVAWYTFVHRDLFTFVGNGKRWKLKNWNVVNCVTILDCNYR